MGQKVNSAFFRLTTKGGKGEKAWDELLSFGKYSLGAQNIFELNKERKAAFLLISIHCVFFKEIVFTIAAPAFDILFIAPAGF